MSMVHYIASPRELSLGSFGVNKKGSLEKSAIKFTNIELPKDSVPLEHIIDLSNINDKKMEVFRSYEDVAGIFVENLDSKREAIKKHFKNPFVYQVSAIWGNFNLNKELETLDIEMYKAHKKCIFELFKYICNNTIENDNFEIYSCWINEESHEKNIDLSKTIYLRTYEIKDSFEFKDKEYILVKC